VTSALLDEEMLLRGVAVDPKNPRRVFVAFSDGVARSSDGGTTWALQTAPDGFYAASIAIDASNPSVLYAQTRGWDPSPGCYKSKDGGVTWTRAAAGVYGSGRRILVADGRVWLACNVGLFRSDNGGASFAPAQTGIAASNVEAFAIAPSSPSTIQAYVEFYGMFRTKTRSASWVRGRSFEDIDGVADVLVPPADPQTVYVLTWHYGEDDLFKSIDGGKTFRSVFRKDVNDLAGDPTDGDRLALAGRIYTGAWGSGPSSFGIYLSDDGGASARPIKIRTDNGSQAQAVAFAPSDPETIYVAGQTAAGAAVVYKSTDGGAAWRLLPGPFQRGFFKIVVDPTSAGTVYIGSYSGVYRSLNGGASWTEISYWGGEAMAVNPLKPAEIFIGGGNGISFSADRGAHWTELDADLAASDVTGIVLDPAARTVYVSTEGAGICRRKF
jgi:hypothetical protein